jgi:hypothetical protein
MSQAQRSQALHRARFFAVLNLVKDQNDNYSSAPDIRSVEILDRALIQDQDKYRCYQLTRYPCSP